MQRSGRKSLTTVQGLTRKIDLNKLTKAFKKEFCCNGSIVQDKGKCVCVCVWRAGVSPPLARSRRRACACAGDDAHNARVLADD